MQGRVSLRAVSVHLGAGLGAQAHSGAETGGRVGNVLTPKSCPRNSSTEGSLTKQSSPRKPSPTLPLPLAPSDPQDLGPTEGLVGGDAGPEGVPA